MKNSILKSLVALVMIPTFLGFGCVSIKKHDIESLEKRAPYERKVDEMLRPGHSSEIDKRIDEGLGIEHRKKEKQESDSKVENYLFGCLVAGQIGDYLTTKQILRKGGKELNPLWGKHPSDTTLLLVKGGFILASYGLGQLFPDDKKTIYGIGCGSGLFGTGFNLYQLSK